MSRESSVWIFGIDVYVKKWFGHVLLLLLTHAGPLSLTFSGVRTDRCSASARSVNSAVGVEFSVQSWKCFSGQTFKFRFEIFASYVDQSANKYRFQKRQFSVDILSKNGGILSVSFCYDLDHYLNLTQRWLHSKIAKKLREKIAMATCGYDGPKIWGQIQKERPPKPLRTNFHWIPWHRETP